MEKMDVYSSLGSQRKKFLSWQMRTILVTMLGYANGYTVDRVKGRIVMALGLLLCAAANFAFGFGVNLSQVFTGTTSGPDFTSALILVMGITIILNQYFQGMGFPTFSRILPHWIHPSELATKKSI